MSKANGIFRPDSSGEQFTGPCSTFERICRKAAFASARLRAMARRDDGSALIEMYVVLPIMLGLILGVSSLGLALNAYIVLSHATDVGARYLAINQGNFGTAATTNPCAMAVTQIVAAAPVLNASQMSYQITLTPTSTGSPTTFKSSNGGGSYGSGSSCAANGTTDMGTGLGTVTVTVTYPYPLLIFGWAPTNVSLQASTTEIIQ
jgi:Flp pilus assembly protein TadG